jgi:starch phosphorylase
MLHGEVSQDMYPEYTVHSITNGVHAPTWTSAPFAALFDRYIPEWRKDNTYLRHAVRIPSGELLDAHQQAKLALIAEVDRRTGVQLNPAVLTIGFARRAATYKRAPLVFRDLDRLREIVRRAGAVQFVFAGKAHPRDFAGQLLIREVFAAGQALAGEVPLVYLEEHDMALGKIVCSGVDVWLNNPERPQEASGTSGMKAALNGVPSLSVLDGWWVEGCVEGVTGWSIGDPDAPVDDAREVESLYDKLQYVVIPLHYERGEARAQMMRSAISLNGSFFNAQRMMEQYVTNAYGLRGSARTRR